MSIKQPDTTPETTSTKALKETSENMLITSKEVNVGEKGTPKRGRTEVEATIKVVAKSGGPGITVCKALILNRASRSHIVILGHP